MRIFFKLFYFVACARARVTALAKWLVAKWFEFQITLRDC